MAEGDRKNQTKSRINEKQRFTFIGFEVFPGKPKDLFKGDAEKAKFVDSVRFKRESDSTLRDDCKLLEERVSFGEKIVLAVSSVVILAALLLPWYSVYTVVPVEAKAPAETEAVLDSAALAMIGADTLAGIEDSSAVMATTDEATTEELTLASDEAAAAEPGEEVLAAEPTAAEATPRVVTHAGERANVQIITAHAARAQTAKEYSYLSGLGVFAALGSVGGPVFSSGFILVLTAVLMLIYGLLCIALPVINLYSIFGLKGKPDDVALKLKKYLRLNWLPLILMVIVIGLSFVGANYGFDPTETFSSLGDSYGIGVLLGSLSWGIMVPLAASMLVAVKGIEI